MEHPTKVTMQMEEKTRKRHQVKMTKRKVAIMHSNTMHNTMQTKHPNSKKPITNGINNIMDNSIMTSRVKHRHPLLKTLKRHQTRQTSKKDKDYLKNN
jgi:hypothetical protein